MTKQSWKTPVLVIADDFTGANDAGSGLARVGANVHVLFDSSTPNDAENADVLVISTDSRAMSAADAAYRTALAVQQYQSIARDGWLFKKIDSTLRGNPGAEIEAALRTSGKTLALVAPAVPRLGRTTREGEVWINQQRLTDTEFASDPKTPVTSGHVLTCLQMQSEMAGETLDLATVRGGKLAQVLASKRGLVVVDAELDTDIALLVAAAATLPTRPLLAGASGLGDALGEFLAERPSRPVLAIVGSMSAIAQQQIARLAMQRNISIIDIDIRQLFAQPAWPQAAEWQLSIQQKLRAGAHCVVRTTQYTDQRHDIEQLCQQHQVSRQELGEGICLFLAQLTRKVCRDTLPAGLYLSGGDVAIAVAQALGAKGFQIQGLVAGCVPHGVLLNSELHLPVMTKAGGFGDENTLVEAIRFIEEKSSE
ncbi:D-threonate kinase [Klebsiella pneumoniae]|uniref:D-threonate kinase n=1 Tax=Klebsiella pneumoniae TaxID=573 RepID=UPI001ABD17F4|nr:four-carbon acid sugar kinase family protein [Klebsiella pneumoniae]MBO3721916.1 four-carbon acid sugar kinase family protein [Klebsiella pneumoniae]HCB0340690.1 four-carbon acid sugar kinase family protein [Klebsiella pneumoniae]HCB0820615.1 four-carbon acid sugar kinase family protein [Klebsiella pneumoniae]HCM5830949.1 four-carbon acid sugar kinase family protein [Klebsiella pneumoniae]